MCCTYVNQMVSARGCYSPVCRWPWVTLPKLVFTAHTLYLIYICWRLDPSEADLTHSLRVFLSTALPVATVHITASSRTRLLSAVLTTPSDTQPYTRRDNTCLAARGMLPCKCVAGETHNTPTPSLQVTMSNVVGRVYTTQRNADK